MTLTELKNMEKKKRSKTLRAMSVEEKLNIVDQIIDRDAETWKRYNRRESFEPGTVICDFEYYFRFIDGGVSLSEKQR